MHRTRLTLAAALAVSLSAFAQDAPPPPAPPMPTIAGGDCGILKQVAMPKVGAQLLYWRCADGREVYFHVRKGWMAETQSADDPAAVRAELLGLHARSRADKVDGQLHLEVLKAVAKVRNQVA
jgi:hypothetical protein